MVRLKFEDIVFFIFLAIILGTSLWLLHGSPTLIGAIISIGIAVFGSELLLWRKVFSIDKSVSLGFMKMKHDIDKFRIEVNNKFDSVGGKLNEISEKIK
ncbi:hypothetical protein CMI42_05330 [Candidatus Pacearchaeota archaeon]|nr:hypothetical protein [Candidatus Pacearchaeota archaeon]|tara:strand:- start:57 stop:353 length:297 start_codon:yes stop_codon:yes gene_type:complete